PTTDIFTLSLHDALPISVAVAHLFLVRPMSRTYRACWSSYLVLTICIGLIPAITLPMALHGERGAAQVAVVGFAALLSHRQGDRDRKSRRLNSSHVASPY